MKLLEIETRSVRALPDGARSLERDRGGAGHLTVVTGPPSVGLTTFLEVIAASAAALGTGAGAAPGDLVRAGEEHAMTRTVWSLDAAERDFAGTEEAESTAEVFFRRSALGTVDADPGLLGLMSRYDHRPGTSKVVYVPARRVTDGGVPPFANLEADLRIKRLAPAPDKFVGVPAALAKHAAGLGERARFDEVGRLFAELVSGVKLAGISPLGHPEFTLGAGHTVALRQLGFAERNAFVLAAAPVLLGLASSVVLLDTPEMGLAPGVAARWIDAFRAHAPAAQWIVATRDPVLVERVEPAARIEIRGSQ